jgi:hypothetical protein
MRLQRCCCAIPALLALLPCEPVLPDFFRTTYSPHPFSIAIAAFRKVRWAGLRAAAGTRLAANTAVVGY